MTTMPTFSLAFAPNPRSRPVMDGTIKPEGIELIPTASGPAETFHRQLTHQEFDVSEMSLSSLAIITAQGNRDWVTLPICTTRTFFGTGALVRTDAGIESPADLKGKRVGVNEYQQTAALWARGFFQHEYGVAPTDVEWWMERTQELSHGGATGFEPPPGVTLRYMDPAKDQNLGGMMANGELDAIYVYFYGGGGINRSTLDLRGHEKVQTLFPNPLAESARYYAKTGIYPINHVVIMRRSLYEQYPWAARNLYDAFVKAKELWMSRALEQAQPFVDAGLLPSNTRAALTTDLFPYGVAGIRHTLETALSYSTEQGLTPRVVSIEELMAPSLLDT